ncbi:MAG: transglycosylase SLT domain-containing protein, partial [Alistipes sp.]|nr:transglycosylase SLT domain-containing protein [Alistipes sp.]
MVLTSFCGFHTRWTVPALASDAIGPGYSLLSEGDYMISPYDELIRCISEEEGHDWRLISAMAYHESRFRSHLVSPRGARGLMQVMPSVARQFGVPVELIADPEINVRLANQLLSSIVDALQMAEDTPAADRMSILLACYNQSLINISEHTRHL